jgi:GTP-binding protein HflX
MLPVFNKTDLVAEPAALRRALADFPDAAAVSALKGEGLGALREAVAERMLAGAEEVEVLLGPADGKAQAFIRRHGRIDESAAEGDSVRLRARLLRGQVGRLERLPGVRVVARGNLRG